MPVLGRSGIVFSVTGFLFSIGGVTGEPLPTGGGCSRTVRSFLELKLDFLVPGENITEETGENESN